MEILATRTEGDTSTVKLIASQGYQLFPSVSPDGRWLTYHSNESGKEEVYVTSFPDVTRTKRVVSAAAGGVLPKWSRDGKELYYMNYEPGEFIAVQILPGDAFTVGDRVTLFSFDKLWPGGPISWEAAPDGRFLMIRPRQSNRPEELIVVENFLEEVRAKSRR
jgi:serine/threonine-protein kinase